MKHRWSDVDRIFGDALDLPVAERERFITQACRADEVLLDAVRSLLAAAEESDEFLTEGGAAKRVTWDGSITAGPVDGNLEPGDRVGAYRLVRKIGRGGSSVVFQAERADGLYDQQLALKVMKVGADDPRIVARFEQERRILASLEHPNIARLVDGGVTEEESPYLVMEHVDGEPVDDYCNHHGLTINQRLKLFVAVADAVQYAHTRLVIHRDLKPTNILVDDDGRVRLLDFGIAKLLDEGLSLETHTGTYLMTPQYASPEQFQGQPVTTSSDIYQLGLLLYELLTGKLPYRVRSRSAGHSARVICDESPPAPSTAPHLADAVDGVKIMSTHGILPERLRHQLTGDLDAIVMMALRKEPERRYRTVEQMAADVSRYLEGLPVEARGSGIGYRLGRFVRRHRAWAAAAILVSMSLVVGTVGTTLQARKAAKEALRANREAETAEQVSEFLVGLFELADPAQARGEEITAREILADGTDRIRRELTDQPEVQVALLDAIGSVYQGLGLFDRCAESFEEAYRIGSRHLGENHPEVLRVLDHRGGAAMAQGRYADAVRLHRQALTRRRELYGERHPEVAESLDHLAVALYGQGNHENTEPMLRTALAQRREFLGEDHPETAETMQNLAFELSRQGRHDEAESLFEEALVINRTVFGPDHPQVAVSMNSLATSLSNQGRYEEALEHYRAALELLRQIHEENHPAIAHSLNNIAVVSGIVGNHAESERLYREALEIYRETLGIDHPEVTVCLANLGASLTYQAHYDEAAAIFREALALQRARLPENHPWIARTLANLGNALSYLEEYDEAAHCLEQALDIIESNSESDPLSSAVVFASLGVSRHGRGDLEEAEELYRKALDTFEATLPPDHPQWARPLIGRGLLLTGRGEAEEAEPLLERALAIRRTVKRPGDVQLAEAEYALGACLVELGRFDEASRLLASSSEVFNTKLGPDHSLSRRARNTLDRIPSES